MSCIHTSDNNLTGWGICQLVNESVPRLPGLGSGCISGGPEAGFAKGSKQHPLFTVTVSQAPPARAHKGFGFRGLLKGSHKDTFSPLRPGVKTEWHRHKKRVVSRQPAAGNSVKAAEGEKSSKHPGKTRALAWAGDKR